MGWDETDWYFAKFFCGTLHWCMVQSAFLFRWSSVENIYPKTGIAINAISLISTTLKHNKHNDTSTPSA